MASPQKENGYTAIANEVLEKLLLFPFPDKTGVPIRLIIFVIRKTWGYQKKVDVISLTQFEKGIKSNRPSVVHWLEYLVKANILVKGKELVRTGIEYSFNKDWEQWKWGVKATQLVKARKLSSMLALTKSSSLALTHKRKKERTKERSEYNSLGAEVIKLFEVVNPACKRMYGNTTQRKACDDLIETYGFEEVSKVIAILPKSNKQPYFPSITTPAQLWDKYQKLKDKLVQKKEETKSRIIL